MRVLVLGATGKLGSRVLSALLAFVRSSSKLPQHILKKLAAIECGNAKSTSDVERAIVKNSCDAIVNTAGIAAMAP
ncbi:hypothetical protein V502_03797 [Pseudogymnoascus sp. VKM F-4520 (FW-2644)]|nr:hypothetical protein V502_03797 [Pseudogymnoascus sp. VKM F-4520 (FW-2644)]